VDLRVSSTHGDQTPSLGLYITNLLGKLSAEAAEDLKRALASDDPEPYVRGWRRNAGTARSSTTSGIIGSATTGADGVV